MGKSSDDDELARTRKERDFYRKLLALDEQENLERFLDEALGMIVEVAGARRGYIELVASRVAPNQPSWSLHRGCSEEDLQEIRGCLSMGVIAEAIATERTIVTNSALADPRFNALKSVQQNKIEAVLCAPIGASPPLGVVYLQDRLEPAPFSEDDRQRAEIFAKHIASVAERLLRRRDADESSDPTRPYRAVLKVPGLIGRSPALARVLKAVKSVAPLDIRVLLLGPPGTGKTDIARIIHDNGPRPRGPFVELNCAGIPDNLFENELFGHDAEGFTGAFKRIDGKIAGAQGGTLFLDEVGELSANAQTKLLQFLQSKKYRRVGSNVDLNSDARIIAATNADLEDRLAKKLLRDDFLSRLEEYTIRVPSLAERKEDIAELMEFFCARACDKYGFASLRLSPGAILAAEASEWTRNIRELAQAVTRAALGAHIEGVPVIERAHLFPDEAPSAAGPDAKAARKTFQAATRDFQAAYVKEVLEETGWKIEDALARLDIGRSTLYGQIKTHRLGRKK